VADASKIAAAVGWKPEVPLREGMIRTIAYYREHGRYYW
jgi:nucleoside-diphosphate-sugar epimerase